MYIAIHKTLYSMHKKWHKFIKRPILTSLHKFVMTIVLKNVALTVHGRILCIITGDIPIVLPNVMHSRL